MENIIKFRPMDIYIFLTFIVILQGNVFSALNANVDKYLKGGKNSSARQLSKEKGDRKMLIIKGNVVFRGEAPDLIPDGSTLTVKFEDTNRMDAPAVELGKMVQKINGYKKGDVLKYEIKTNKQPENGMGGSLSAVLNINWAANGDEWIRQGDWLNDTHHDLHLSANTTEYNRDVEIKHYT